MAVANSPCSMASLRTRVKNSRQTRIASFSASLSSGWRCDSSTELIRNADAAECSELTATAPEMNP